MCRVLQGLRVDALLLNTREPGTRLYEHKRSSSLPEAEGSEKGAAGQKGKEQEFG